LLEDRWVSLLAVVVATLVIVWVLLAFSLFARVFAIRPLARLAIRKGRPLFFWKAACAVGSSLLWAGLLAGTMFLSILFYWFEVYGPEALGALTAAILLGVLLPALLSRTVNVKQSYWSLIHKSLGETLPPEYSDDAADSMRLRFNQNHTLLISGGPNARMALNKVFAGGPTVIHGNEGTT
jgi:hypothetical protein